MPIHGNIISMSDGATVDTYASTVGDTIPAAQTLNHRVVVQNRSSVPIVAGSPGDLAASPPLGLTIDAGKDFTVDLRTPDRLNIKNASGSTASSVHIETVTT